MTRLVALIVAAVVAVGVQTSFANCGKCPGDKAKSEAKGYCSSMDKLNLSAEQKAKVDALVAECQKGKCDKASKEKMQAGMKEILTADQYKQWDAQCKAACEKPAKAAGCCPAKKAEKKTE
jgi:outer membrane PBP1 activator LpoA protein